MNLKEAFQYQKYIDGLVSSATLSITSPYHALLETKTHKRKAANPDDENIIEVVDNGEFIKNDDLIKCINVFIGEKDRVTKAINKAKAESNIGDIDAMIMSNKVRREFAYSLGRLLSIKPSKATIVGTGYKFNADGNQTPYCYEIDVEKKDNFDRENAIRVRRRLNRDADAVSSDIERIMINTEIDMEPMFSVHDTLEEAVEKIVS